MSFHPAYTVTFPACFHTALLPPADQYEPLTAFPDASHMDSLSSELPAFQPVNS